MLVEGDFFLELLDFEIQDVNLVLSLLYDIPEFFYLFLMNLDVIVVGKFYRLDGVSFVDFGLWGGLLNSFNFIHLVEV